MSVCVCIHAYMFIEIYARRHKLLAVITIYLKFKYAEAILYFTYRYIHIQQVENRPGTET